MDAEKRKRLEAAGYVVGDIGEFLGLTPEEVQLIDLKIEVARAIKAARVASGITQAQLAKKVGSSQPRIAAAETGGSGATLDLLFRMLFAVGGKLGRSVESATKKRATPVRFRIEGGNRPAERRSKTAAKPTAEKV